jgi:hypothetical protein
VLLTVKDGCQPVYPSFPGRSLGRLYPIQEALYFCPTVSYKYSSTQRLLQCFTPPFPSSPLCTGLSASGRLLHHLCLLLAESLRNPLASCHELLDASCDAAGFPLDQGLGGEVIDAGVEAVGYEVGEHLGLRLVTCAYRAQLELPDTQWLAARSLFWALEDHVSSTAAAAAAGLRTGQDSRIDLTCNRGPSWRSCSSQARLVPRVPLRSHCCSCVFRKAHQQHAIRW